MHNPRLWLAGGTAGMACIACYLLAIAVPWPETQLGTSTSLLVAAAFPVLGIVYSYALCSFVAAERDGAANRLGLIFAVAGFSTLLAMLVSALVLSVAPVAAVAQSTPKTLRVDEARAAAFSPPNTRIEVRAERTKLGGQIGALRGTPQPEEGLAHQLSVVVD